MILALIGSLTLALAGQQPAGTAPPPALVPFGELDSLCTNDWWNREPSPIVETRVPRGEVIAFGIYTVHAGSLKLSAQLFPLYPDETRTVRLERLRDGEWIEAGRAQVNDLGWPALLRIDDRDATRDVPYQLRHSESAAWRGTIRRDSVGRNQITLAALSCNSSFDRGARPNYVRNLLWHDPGLVFFAGDQSYDHRQHTAAWLKFGLQFREVFRDRPCVTIPDDHDVGQSNLWGESGKVAGLPGSADGGYDHHPEYVRMVERCQTAHLPDPVDPRPIGQGIGVYFTNLRLGGVDFAILEDRKFESGPAGKIPQQSPRPDHITDPDYDPKSIDLEGLSLLGERQLAFLERWGADRAGTRIKVVLSQTGFCGAAHLHGDATNRLFADLDSNGWPQSGRDRAPRLIRAAGAVHVAGDQHLATVLQHGIDEFRDGPWAFVVPAGVNSVYERGWHPADDAPGANRDADSPLPFTGDYFDGFGNRITMHSYANPDAGFDGEGYGLIRFDEAAREATFECWTRTVDVSDPAARQFVGWPITVPMRADQPRGRARLVT
ncbi:MAG: hypothetical protein KDC14_12240 [Planctomycetes bacterium]|nr:hypothetical protein [Planctomycetota bacterium]